MQQCMAIGGNLQVDGPILEEFYRRCQTGEGPILILPTASARAEGGLEIQRRFNELGSHRPVVVLPVHDRAAAGEEAYVRQARAAGGIFFTGGDQLRLATVLTGTPLLNAVRECYRAGIVVAGTSAGAAILGKVSIIRGRSGSAARAGMAHFAEGFGLLEDTIIDQHFHQKNRLGRLIYAITVHPGSLGIGIDENTAALFEGNQLTVLGKNSVTVLDGQSIAESNVDQLNAGELFSVAHLCLTQLTAGSRYDLARRAALIQRNPLEI